MVRILDTANPQAVTEAAAVLKAGGIIVYPTDTVYGLGALATDDEAIRRLFAIKGRSLEKPLPLLIGESSDVEGIAKEIPAVAEALMERFWPGGLTIVFLRSPRFHSLALAGDTVALRLPDHSLLREVIRRVGGPITGTSANRTGQAAPLICQEALAQLGEGIDLALDGGPCPGGVESTIIDITRDPPALLREGAIGRKRLESILGRTVSLPVAPRA